MGNQIQSQGRIFSILLIQRTLQKILAFVVEGKLENIPVLRLFIKKRKGGEGEKK